MIRLVSSIAILIAVMTTTAGARVWSIDYGSSSLKFTVQWSGEPFVATFRSWKANIDLGPAAPGTGHIDATVDLASEGSDTPDNDEGLKGPQGFWVDRFRYAHFVSTKIEAMGNGNYNAAGSLSLHGVSHPVRLSFHLAVTGSRAHATGSAQLLRTDFGLGTGEWAGTSPIAHEVNVSLDVTATSP